MQQGIAKFKHGPPFFANLTIIANYICGISKAHFRLIFLALHGAYAFKARVFSEKNRALFFFRTVHYYIFHFYLLTFITMLSTSNMKFNSGKTIYRQIKSVTSLKVILMH